jgi:hypothetical protein
MKGSNRTLLLERLDYDRWALAEHGNVAREYSPDRSECRIIQAKATSAEIAAVIAAEKALADQHRYKLEWKVYGHDGPANLVESLLAAGFEPEEEESLLVLPLATLSCSAKDASDLPPGTEIVRVQDELGLEGVAEISREIGRREVEAEIHRLAAILRDTPSAMSVHILRLAGEPVSCGRVHYPPNSEFAELAGGRTKTMHRRKGFFSALVWHRLIEAAACGRTDVLVDALPTSEPLLRRFGFMFLTHTRPFIYEPSPSRSIALGKTGDVK